MNKNFSSYQDSKLAIKKKKCAVGKNKNCAVQKKKKNCLSLFAGYNFNYKYDADLAYCLHCV